MSSAFRRFEEENENDASHRKLTLECLLLSPCSPRNTMENDRDILASMEKSVWGGECIVSSLFRFRKTPANFRSLLFPRRHDGLGRRVALCAFDFDILRLDTLNDLIPYRHDFFSFLLLTHPRTAAGLEYRVSNSLPSCGVFPSTTIISFSAQNGRSSFHSRFSSLVSILYHSSESSSRADLPFPSTKRNKQGESRRSSMEFSTPCENRSRLHA